MNCTVSQKLNYSYSNILICITMNTVKRIVVFLIQILFLIGCVI